MISMKKKLIVIQFIKYTNKYRSGFFFGTLFFQCRSKDKIIISISIFDECYQFIFCHAKKIIERFLRISFPSIFSVVIFSHRVKTKKYKQSCIYYRILYSIFYAFQLIYKKYEYTQFLYHRTYRSRKIYTSR